MSKFNLSKIAKEDYVIQDKMLEENTSSSDIPEKNINISIPTKDKDNTKPFESQLEANRDGKDSLMVTEQAMNESKKVYNDKRSDEWDTSVMPINILSQTYDDKKVKALKKAEEGEPKDTTFWDKYVGVQMEGPITKVDNNIPASASQLQNKPERFKNFDSKDGIETAINPKINKMTMASLKDADAMIFHIYAQATQRSRELTDREKQMVLDINSGKMRVLSQNFLTEQDVNVQDGFREIVSPEKKNETEAPLTKDNIKFDLFEGPNGEGQLCSKVDGRVIHEFPTYEVARDLLSKKGINFDVQF